MQKLFFTILAVAAAVGWAMPSAKPPGTPPPPAAAAPAPAPNDGFAPVATGDPVVLERSPTGQFAVDAEVNHDLVHFVVDTGSTAVALTVDDARRLGIPFSESDFAIVARGASGDVRGLPIVLERISVGGKEVRQVRGAIIQDLGVSLLGQTYLTRLASVRIAGDRMELE
jgi:aspartyl protease family protein